MQVSFPKGAKFSCKLNFDVEDICSDKSTVASLPWKVDMEEVKLYNCQSQTSILMGQGFFFILVMGYILRMKYQQVLYLQF